MPFGAIPVYRHAVSGLVLPGSCVRRWKVHARIKRKKNVKKKKKNNNTVKEKINRGYL